MQQSNDISERSIEPAGSRAGRRPYPASPERLPSRSLSSGRYTLHFARTDSELEPVYRLRYRVFNLELGEGLDSSHESGLDVDPFDPYCHHMYVIDDRTDSCIGTYRLQTAEMARDGIGFYSATEFDFAGIPETIQAQSVEAGRACIEANHRELRVLHLFWQGLGMYLSHNGKRYLFGCCSLTSQKHREGLAVLEYLQHNGHMLTDWQVQPQPEFACAVSNGEPPLERSVKIPRLMKAYLSQGAKICGPPAIDRAFKTIDFLALFDTESVSDSISAFYQIRR